MYFALTMLSTVGYGDYFPIHPLEQVLAVIIMLMGVAVFSWVRDEIMGFIEDPEIEYLERQLREWIVGLQRFPGLIPQTLSQEMYHDMQYYWTSDRLRKLRDQDANNMPFDVMHELIAKFIYSDLKVLKSDRITYWDPQFVFAIYYSLKPRLFRASDQEECLVAEEGTFASEVLYIMRGAVSVGFSRLNSYKLS